jgi:phosphoglycerate dehydrogenase-like enzyme
MPCVPPAAQDKLYAPEHITELMAGSDYVVVATPYTPSTHGLVSAAAIAAMKPNGVLVNVGRGKCIDEEALIAGGCLEPRCDDG